MTVFFSEMTPLVASGGFEFALQESTIPGKLILAVLFMASIFSWTVMITKFKVLNHAKQENAAFLEAFHTDRQSLRLYEAEERFDGSPLFHVYRIGCRELTFHLLGSPEVDETFAARLEVSDKISLTQMRMVISAMERAVGEAGLHLEGQMILLATAVSASPFLGLLGTVWGVMDTFSGMAREGSASLAAIAPGVSGALLTTVTALLVAIPAMFGYNFLVTTLKAIIVQTDHFASELASEFEHKYVSLGEKRSPFNP